MKKLFLYTALGIATVISGCTKNFESINTDPTQASGSTFNPNLLLSTVEIGYANAISGYAGPILFQSMWVQTFASASYPSYYSNGDKYVASGNTTTYQESMWNNAYSAASRAREIQNLTAGNAAYTNLSTVAAIMEIASLELVTDTYGDCPYFQSLNAKSSATYLPVYDKQQTIYPAMLSRLDSALKTFDATKATPANDAFNYKGDITKWKKFGYSLMLRMAMRMTKVDAAMAQTYAEKAAAGGTFSSAADNAYLTYDTDNGYNNPNVSSLLTPSDYSEVKWGQKLIDLLKTNNDPRLAFISEIPPHGPYLASGVTDPTKAVDSSTVSAFSGNSTPSAQLGMPNGYDQNGGATDISKASNYPGPSTNGGITVVTGKYSRPKTSLYINFDRPVFILTYPETEFLLAEAATKGWNVGVAATHYANGVAGSLLSYGQIDGTTPISSADALAYAAAHPLGANALEQINTQFWITTGTLFNFLEAWNNWRRSGYPVLTPVNYVGNFSNGQIPHRQPYPLSEATTNGANYTSAVAVQGADDWTTRMWWDK